MEYFLLKLVVVVLLSAIPLCGAIYAVAVFFSRRLRNHVTAHPSDHLLWLAVWIILLAIEIGFVRPVVQAARRATAKSWATMLMFGMRAYYAEYGVMPVGGNARIVSALCGNNPGKVIFMDPPPGHLNPGGEYLDPWGTPYRIDATNASFPWAYSCGPNKRDDGGGYGTDDIASWN